MNRLTRFKNVTMLSARITPIYSHHHAQNTLCDHGKMCGQIRHGISKHPHSLHSFQWNSLFQSTSSIVDLIHLAASRNVRLLIDVNPNDVYAHFLWKGLHHMYPDTPLIYTYNQTDVQTVQSDLVRRPDYMKNIKMCAATYNQWTRLTNDVNPPENLIVTYAANIKRPYRAHWIVDGSKQSELLYIPLIL
jgi:hypothetical protein